MKEKKKRISIFLLLFANLGLWILGFIVSIYKLIKARDKKRMSSRAEQ